MRALIDAAILTFALGAGAFAIWAIAATIKETMK